MSSTQAQPAVPHQATSGAPDPAESLDARFKAWRTLVKNLEDYFKHLEKVHESSAKDHHKLAKVLEVPFKHTGHFEQAGIQDVFTALQTTTQRWGADQEAYAKAVRHSLVAQASTLEDEIQSFEKRLKKDGLKGAKGVSKLQTETQKHIETLGKHTSSFETNPKGVKADHDPFLVKRGILKQLSKQTEEENAHTETVLAFQKQCEEFEIKIVRSIQAMIAEVSRQHAAEGQDFQSSSNSMLTTSQQLAPDHEWKAFTARDHSLLSSNVAKRDVSSIVFAGADHPSTAPVLEGDLMRKGTVMKKYSPAYFVLTKAGFLHEFKSKSIESDPEPAWTLDIKDATIGAHSTQTNGKNKFVVSGKSKGLLSSKHDYAFQATSYDDMMKWWTALCKFAANAPTPESAELMDDSDTEIASPSASHAHAATAPTTGTVPEHAVPVGHAQPAAAAPGGYAQPAAAAPGGYAQPAAAAPGGYAQPAAAAPGGYAQPAAAAPGGYAQPATAAGYAQPAATQSQVPTQQMAQTNLSGTAPAPGPY
ncbi:hypothetical protein BCR37DRAFT_379754 [Protomyces lactucae-debilis]|uniref:PH domain-containing protein n=1 Tax=Protomyces lactucae-debilis TaxID=2754530 RepID=A0A1Y2FD61_PROLT|nr:uncharacterized protein BCR37DRAFT_379754 [Protomyces lactucae-debilis]ORY81862.1 hypothetical protein BCR37DRAFT_379754 [Protomyces lactucae-debilis]